MTNDAAKISRQLGERAESVCRRYLSNGKRQGRYWLVGDVDNTPGRSLYVRLSDCAKGPAGKWTDAATGEHGDLLDLISATRRLHSLPDILDEARGFLSLPAPKPPELAPRGSAEAARRLWAISQPIAGTLAETYLQHRGLVDIPQHEALRYHPRCWYRGDRTDERDSTRDAWPALIAAVRDGDGTLTGVHRTWLDPSRHGQGISVDAEAHAGGPHRPWRAVWSGGRCARGGRGHRDGAIAALRSAAPSDDRRTVGQSPRRPHTATDAAPPLHRPRPG